MGGTTDRAHLGTLLEGLAAQFRAELTEAQLHVMWLGLRDLTRRELERAVGQALMTSRFFPNVAELRKLAGKANPRRWLRVVHGKTEVFMEGRGWGEFHGPASWFEDGPSPIGDGMEGLLRLEAPPAPGERGR